MKDLKRMAGFLLLTLTVFAAGQAPPKPLTNADVIEMTKKGMSIAEITKVITSSPINFDISYPAMLQLQQAGVDPAIGNLMMNLSVGKVVAAQLGGNTTLDMMLPPQAPPGRGQQQGQKQKVQKQQLDLTQTMAMSDDDFKAQQDQAVQTLAEHGCFGPDGPKASIMGGKAMMCQGVSSNMAPGSSANIAGATTTVKSGFMIGGEHSITSVLAVATFKVDLGEVRGTSMADFRPLLVKLSPSSASRIVSRTNMAVVAKLPTVRFETELQDDPVPADIALDARMSMASRTMIYLISPKAPLPPGEYGIVIRRGGSPNMRMRNASNDPAMGIVQAVWDFRVEP